MGIQSSDWVENIVEKGEIARYKNFSLSHDVFKSCLLLMRQNEYLRSKGLIQKDVYRFVDTKYAAYWHKTVYVGGPIQGIKHNYVLSLW